MCGDALDVCGQRAATWACCFHSICLGGGFVPRHMVSMDVNALQAMAQDLKGARAASWEAQVHGQQWQLDEQYGLPAAL